MKTTFDYISELARLRGWTVSNTARHLGLSRQRVSWLKRNIHGDIEPETVFKLAKLLNIEPVEILSAISFHQSTSDEARNHWRDIHSRVFDAGWPERLLAERGFMRSQLEIVYQSA